MTIIAFLRSTMRLATAIFLSIFALAAVAGAGTAGYYYWQKSQAKEYETAKLWTADLSSILQFSLRARTKMVDGRLYMIVATDSFPLYMKYQRLGASDESKGFVLKFMDKDGFNVFAKSIPLNSMSNIVDATGTPIGLSVEADEYLDLETYASFSKFEVQWNFSTESSPAESAATVPTDAGPDHCAPNLSKAERLQRLAAHGPIRQNGGGSYSVGYRRVTFYTTDDSLLNCQ